MKNEEDQAILKSLREKMDALDIGAAQKEADAKLLKIIEEKTKSLPKTAKAGIKRELTPIKGVNSRILKKTRLDPIKPDDLVNFKGNEEENIEEAPEPVTNTRTSYIPSKLLERKQYNVIAYKRIMQLSINDNASRDYATDNRIIGSLRDIDRLPDEQVQQCIDQVDTEVDGIANPKKTDIAKALSQYFTFGYHKHRFVQNELLTLRDTIEPGYLYVDISRMIKLQESVNYITCARDSAYRMLWEFIEVGTDYFDLEKDEYPAISRTVRTKDVSKIRDGSLFTKRQLDKAISIICRDCSFKQSTAVLQHVLGTCLPAVESCIVWDVNERIYARKGANRSDIDPSFPVLHVSKAGTNKEELGRILVLVESNKLIYWLLEYLNNISCIRAATAIYLRKSSSACTYRFDVDKSVQFYIKTLRHKVLPTITDAIVKTLSSKNIKEV